jgi:hypothetical protein
MNERDKRKRKWGSRQELHLTGVRTDKFRAMKAPRQCPLVLLVKVGCTEGRCTGVENVKK